MPLTKTYIVVNVRRESKDVIVMDLQDESSTPPIKTAAFRMGVDDYQALGYPNPATTKVTIAITVVEQATPETST